MRGDVPSRAACYCGQEQAEAAMGGLTPCSSFRLVLATTEQDSCTGRDHLHQPLLHWSGYWAIHNRQLCQVTYYGHDPVV